MILSPDFYLTYTYLVILNGAYLLIENQYSFHLVWEYFANLELKSEKIWISTYVLIYFKNKYLTFFFTYAKKVWYKVGWNMDYVVSTSTF